MNETKLNSTIVSTANIYNDTSKINLINTTSNIMSLGFYNFTYANSLYGQLAGTNAWSNSNTFTGTVTIWNSYFANQSLTANMSIMVTKPNGDVAILLNTTGNSYNSGNFTAQNFNTTGRITSNATCSYLYYDGTGVLRDAIC
jgi:hypothetical protein